MAVEPTSAERPVCFRPEPEVKAIIDRVRRNNMEVTWLVNESIKIAFSKLKKRLVVK